MAGSKCRTRKAFYLSPRVCRPARVAAADRPAHQPLNRSCIAESGAFVSMLACLQFSLQLRTALPGGAKRKRARGAQRGSLLVREYGDSSAIRRQRADVSVMATWITTGSIASIRPAAPSAGRLACSAYFIPRISRPTRLLSRDDVEPADGLRQFTFVDIGSGKGRTLLMASQFPFRKIVGVELIAELHQRDQENLRAVPVRDRSSARRSKLSAEMPRLPFSRRAARALSLQSAAGSGVEARDCAT